MNRPRVETAAPLSRLIWKQWRKQKSLVITRTHTASKRLKLSCLTKRPENVIKVGREWTVLLKNTGRAASPHDRRHYWTNQPTTKQSTLENTVFVTESWTHVATNSFNLNKDADLELPSQRMQIQLLNVPHPGSAPLSGGFCMWGARRWFPPLPPQGHLCFYLWPGLSPEPAASKTSVAKTGGWKTE